MKKRYVNLILAMVSASAMALGSVPAMAATDSAKTESAKNDSKEDAEASNEKEADAAKTDTLEDGVYTAEFDTDSSMFHANEAYDGRGLLTVENGEMTLHVSMPSKNIVNLFVGKAEDAKKSGAKLLEPTTDTVTYSDGTTEEVYGFDVPVTSLDKEFDLALIGKKGVWYDHRVSVSDPQPLED